MHLHGPAPLHITSPSVTRKSLGTLPPLLLSLHHCCYLELAGCWPALPIEVLSCCCPIPSPVAHCLSGSHCHLDFFPCSQLETEDRDQSTIHDRDSTSTSTALHCLNRAGESWTLFGWVSNNNGSFPLSTPGPRLISVTSIPPGYLIRCFEVLVRYHLSLSVHPQFHSFLRPSTASPITATVDHGQPTTQTLPRQDHTHSPRCVRSPSTHRSQQLLAPLLGPSGSPPPADSTEPPSRSPSPPQHRPSIAHPSLSILRVAVRQGYSFGLPLRFVSGRAPLGSDRHQGGSIAYSTSIAIYHTTHTHTPDTTQLSPLPHQPHQPPYAGPAIASSYNYSRHPFSIDAT